MNSIIRHTDFQKAYLDYNAWKTDSSFPIKSVTNDCIKKLNEYEIIEYIFKGVGYDRDQFLYEEKLKQFLKCINAELFKEERNNLYLYSIEHKKQNLSRLRSYKGLLDKKKVIEQHYFQTESKLEQGQTIISFICTLLETNVDYLLKFFFDDTTCFVIKSNNNYLNKEFLDLILSTLNLSGNIQLDYLKLLLLFCQNNDIIYRIGGDSGEEYWSLQKFLKKAV